MVFQLNAFKMVLDITHCSVRLSGRMLESMHRCAGCVYTVGAYRYICELSLQGLKRYYIWI